MLIIYKINIGTTPESFKLVLTSDSSEELEVPLQTNNSDKGIFFKICQNVQIRTF